MDREQFSAYVVIPSRVFFNSQIGDKGKLLYGLISCMSNTRGYCFAKNETLAKYMGADDRTIRRLLKDLCDAGVILMKNTQGGRKTSREIWITDALNVDKNVHVNVDKNVRANMDKNVHQNNTSINNTPIAPTGGAPEAKKKTTMPKDDKGNVILTETQQDMFDEFWMRYPRKTGKEPARRKWYELNPDAATLTKMVNAIAWQKESEQWKDSDGRYIPHPSTWLNQRRWEDDPPVKKQTVQEVWLE